MQIEKRIGREKKRCGYAPFNSAQQAIKLRSLRSLRPSGKLPSATCFIAGPLGAMRRGEDKMLVSDVVYQIERDFESADVSEAIFALEEICGSEFSDRIVRCVVFLSKGRLSQLREYIQLARIDYRDVIYQAEYDCQETRKWDFTQPFPKQTS